LMGMVECGVYRVSANMHPENASMASCNILTVRMSEDELIKLDQLAKLQDRPRSQYVQDALKELIRSTDGVRQRQFLRAKAQLAPAVKEQCALLEKSSVADEHRRF